MTQTIIETVRFRLNDSTTDAAFLEDLTPTQQFLSQQPGFLTRRLSRDEEGNWLELIEWKDQACADAADIAFSTFPNMQHFLAHIDRDSVTMGHMTVQHHMEA